VHKKEERSKLEKGQEEDECTSIFVPQEHTKRRKGNKMGLGKIKMDQDLQGRTFWRFKKKGEEIKINVDSGDDPSSQ